MSDPAVESRRPEEPEPRPEPALCANCGVELRGPYCGACGQKRTALNPSFHNFLHDLVHELLHVDGKIVKSARLLLTRPGFLTREWLAGRRVRYVAPIRLYLIFSVLFFATGAISPTRVSVRVIPGGTGLQDATDAIKRLSELSDQQSQEEVGHMLAVWGPRTMFVLVPFCAVLVAAVTRASGRNYLQHLYFALHVHGRCSSHLTRDSRFPNHKSQIANRKSQMAQWWCEAPFMRPFQPSSKSV